MKNQERIKEVVSVTMDPELKKRVDKRKGRMSRSAFIENLIITGLGAGNEMNLEIKHATNKRVGKK